MLRISSPDDVAAFPKSKWGIPEPPLPAPFEKERDDGTYAGQMDLVLVPGVSQSDDVCREREMQDADRSICLPRVRLTFPSCCCLNRWPSTPSAGGWAMGRATTVRAGDRASTCLRMPFFCRVDLYDVWPVQSHTLIISSSSSSSSSHRADCLLARLGESNAAKGGPRPYTVVRA